MRNTTENMKKPQCKLNRSLTVSPQTTGTVLLLCLRKGFSKIKKIQKSKSPSCMGNFHRLGKRKEEKIKARNNNISRTQSKNNKGYVSISPESAGTSNCYPMKLKSFKSKKNPKKVLHFAQ